MIEDFERDGFMIVENLLTDEELDHFTPVVVDAVARRSCADTRPLHERTRYEQSFQQCQNLWEDTPDIRPLTFHQRIGETAAQLLRADAVRLWHDQALFKRAGAPGTDPHQDQPYWPIAEAATVTAWIPLDGSTIANGAMGYYPGSHRVGLNKFQNIFAAEGTDELLASPELAGIEPVYVEVPRGAVAFHAGYTVHCAKPNTTDHDRAVHTVIMFADGCTRASKQFHMSVDRDEIAVGAAIRGACTPIVWPRATLDDLAPPPPMPTMLRKIAPIGVLPGQPA